MARKQAGRLIGDIADLDKEGRAFVVPELVRRIPLVPFLDIKRLIIVTKSGNGFAPVVERQPGGMPLVFKKHGEVA